LHVWLAVKCSMGVLPEVGFAPGAVAPELDPFFISFFPPSRSNPSLPIATPF